MKKLNSAHLLVLFTLNCYILSSQIKIDTTLLSINDTVHNFYVIKNNITLNSSQFLNNATSYCRLGTSNQFSILESRIDSLHETHQKLTQKVNGIPIENSKIILHSDKNLRLTAINGVIENNIGSINTTPNITAQTAIINAINLSENKAFLWQDSLNEKKIREVAQDSTATSYPTATLIIAKNNSQLYNLPSNYFLAYKIAIHYADRTSLVYYVDAHTGAITKTENGSRACFNSNTKISKNQEIEGNPITPLNTTSTCKAYCQTGTAKVYYYPNQYIYTERFIYGLVYCNYRLRESCSSTDIYVTDGATDFHDGTNNWVSPNDIYGTTTFFSLSWANRFWQGYLGRNSFDDNGHNIEAQVGSSYATQWNTSNDILTVGPTGGNTTFGVAIGNWMNSLDIMGHELTHGVTHSICNLDGHGESGAIDEGISDIFGTLTEFWAANHINIGKSGNYDIGEDVSSDCGKRRSLSNPELYCCPNTYGGTNWVGTNDISISNDLGGIHHNCGVLGKWFYLLAEGGSGTNDLGNQYCVKAIGQDDASWILYEAMRCNMTHTTNYNDLRFFTEYQAFRYYGFSPQYAAVQQAWYAVGLDYDLNSTGLPINIFGKTETTNKNYNYNARMQVYNYVTNPSTIVDMSSNDNIWFFSEDPPQTAGAVAKDVYIKSGSEFHAYIAPACSGGARMGNPNQTSTNENFLEKTSSNQYTKSDFVIMPNPTTGIFKLQTNTDLEYPKQIIIRNVMGQTIRNIENVSSFENEFNLSKENAGIYVINVYYNDKVMSKRIIIE